MSGLKTLPELQRELVRAAHVVAEKGYAPALVGNLSVLTAEGRILITPAEVSLADVREGDLVVVDRYGRRQSGNYDAPLEVGMHLAVYRGRPDVKAIVHCHPPFSTISAINLQPIVAQTMPEFLLHTGGTVPVVPFGLPDSEALVGHLSQFIEEYDVVLLAHHGVLGWADSIQGALALVDHTEFAARVMTDSGARKAEMPSAIITSLLDMRTKLGRGAAGRIRVASRLK